jgi:hypothetical protein
LLSKSTILSLPKKGKSIYGVGLIENMTPDQMTEYNNAIKKIISQVKAFDPKFFDDFEKFTGKKIDFDLW